MHIYILSIYIYTYICMRGLRTRQAERKASGTGKKHQAWPGALSGAVISSKTIETTKR